MHAKTNFQGPAIDFERELEPNCFTIGRLGPVKTGLAVSMSQFGASVKVGEYHLNRDRYHGCVVHEEKGQHLVRRAYPFRVETGMKPFYTLKSCGRQDPGYIVVKASLANRDAPPIVMNGHPVRVFTDVVGGSVIARDRGEVVVVVDEGEDVTFFFENGAVRSFKVMRGKLDEQETSYFRSINLRIAQAFATLSSAADVESDEDRQREIRTVLYGMADLLALTTFVGETGTKLREKIVLDFFRKLPEDEFTLVQKKVAAVLYAVDDVPLIGTLRKPIGRGVAGAPGPRKADPTRLARDARRAARDAQNAEQRRLMKGATNGGGNKKQQGGSKKK
jgi:hypothetical protein